MSSDTIVAIATAPGQGGVAIVRLSGSKALAIAKTISTKNKITPRYAHYASFYDEKNDAIDVGLLLYFKAPHSFTGEDVVEFHAHGSPKALESLVRRCCLLGARLARPGEFSERAFLNDKMDLTQAEAIASLIEAQSETAARLAVRSLQGEFSEKIESLLQSLIALRMYIEAAIDFPEEEIDFLADGMVESELLSITSSLKLLLAQTSQGAILREGMSVVLAGRPNAGKSTLINQLAGKELAIVTEIPGTTRDVMRENILIDDIPVHLIDTAGLRDSHDVVEKQGIMRAWDEIKQADCILLLVDIAESDESQILLEEVKSALPSNIPVLTIVNKIDKQGVQSSFDKQKVMISAKNGDGIDLLKEQLKNIIGFVKTDGQILARARHVDALERAYRQLKAAFLQVKEQKAFELLAEDLRQTQQIIGEITGEYSADDLLGEIFSSFCIGK
jgi:tRNA modification GTPase